MRLDQIVHRDPDILSGTPVFLGTRVPIQTLFDYLEGGDSRRVSAPIPVSEA
jgi:uncharacterized protein (DUF433 family)